MPAINYSFRISRRAQFLQRNHQCVCTANSFRQNLKQLILKFFALEITAQKSNQKWAEDPLKRPVHQSLQHYACPERRERCFLFLLINMNWIFSRHQKINETFEITVTLVLMGFIFISFKLVKVVVSHKQRYNYLNCFGALFRVL